MSKNQTEKPVMSKRQYRLALETLAISQHRAAKLFGVDGRTSQRWALGENEVPKWAAALLRLMIETKTTPDEVEKLI